MKSRWNTETRRRGSGWITVLSQRLLKHCFWSDKPRSPEMETISQRCAPSINPSGTSRQSRSICTSAGSSTYSPAGPSLDCLTCRLWCWWGLKMPFPRSVKVRFLLSSFRVKKLYTLFHCPSHTLSTRLARGSVCHLTLRHLLFSCGF